MVRHLLPLLLLLLLLLLLPAVLPSPVPAAQFWMLAWSNHQMTVLASVPASSRTECGVRCARRQGCAASSYDATATPLTCRLLACEDGWTAFSGNCYWYGATASDWLAAEIIHCSIERMSHLVSVLSAEENAFVATLATAQGATRLHIGLQRQDSGFVWTQSGGTELALTVFQNAGLDTTGWSSISRCSAWPS